MSLPPFVPIEETCPGWPEARQLIEGAIPERLTFYLSKWVIPSADYRRLEALSPVAPQEYATLLMRLNQLVYEAVDSERLLQCTRAEARVPPALATLADINAELARQDDLRVECGKPSIRQIMRHVLGLEPAPGSTP